MKRDILDVKVPAINTAFYPNNQRNNVENAITKIYQTYKEEIDLVSKISNVPVSILSSFIFIESGGNEKAISSAKAIGLMQLKPDSASDILVMENNKGFLDEPEKKILAEKLGKRFTNGILRMKFLGQKVTVDGRTSAVWVTEKDLFDPLLNILIGAIYLGQLIGEHTENGTVRFDKIVIRYNRGYFSDNRGKNLKGDIASVIQNVPTESKNFVLKLLGINGTFDVLTTA